LKDRFSHVSYERLLSGAGLISIYRFLIDVKKEKELSEVKEKSVAEDPAKIITEYAMKQKCPVCVKAVNQFASIYGSEAANMALKFFALGGVYIGGGIAPKMLSFLESGIFMKAFLEKGRLNSVLSTIKVQVILNQETALLGAAYYMENKFFPSK
jgi:glucokinase